MERGLVPFQIEQGHRIVAYGTVWPFRMYRVPLRGRNCARGRSSEGAGRVGAGRDRGGCRAILGAARPMYAGAPGRMAPHGAPGAGLALYIGHHGAPARRRGMVERGGATAPGRVAGAHGAPRPAYPPARMPLRPLGKAYMPLHRGAARGIAGQGAAPHSVILGAARPPCRFFRKIAGMAYWGIASQPSS